METKWRILKAISAGYSYEQVMADDSTVSHHDMFRVMSEAPTSFWKRAARKKGRVAPRATRIVFAIRHLKD